MHASTPTKIALASLLLAALTPLVAAQSDTDSAAASTMTSIDNTNNVNCPGVLVNNNGESYCCVGGELTLSTCPGWPICTGSGTVDPATQTESCVTRIPVTQSDYSQLISSYSESLSGGSGGSGGAAAATATGESASASASESTESESGNVSGSNGADNTASGSGASSASSEGSGGRVGPLGALAGGLLGLAAML